MSCVLTYGLKSLEWAEGETIATATATATAAVTAAATATAAALWLAEAYAKFIWAVPTKIADATALPFAVDVDGAAGSWQLAVASVLPHLIKRIICN